MVAILKRRTPAELADAQAHPGRRHDRLAGGYVDDLAELKKAILLCPVCRPKFDAMRAGYGHRRGVPSQAMGDCDGCREVTVCECLVNLKET